MNNISYIVAALITVSAAIPSSAIESSVLDKAGMKLPSIELPVPSTPKNNNWMTLRKITVNEAQPDMDDTLIGLVDHGQNIDKVVKELNDNGFKASASQDNHGGYMVMVDVAGLNAADMAVGLARYYYITEVQVGRNVHNQLFGLNNKSAVTRNNNWMSLRKITVNEAQPDMENTLVGLVDHGQNIDKVVKELNDNGFKASASQDNQGGYMVMVDVTGLNAADLAVGLSRYYYITEVKVSRKVHNQLFGLNNKSTFAVKMGTIKGGMNHSPVDVKFNKLAWTFTGGMNNSPLDVKINHEEKTITGGANGSPVDLKFNWSTEQVTVYGGANHSEVNYTVNWKNGLLEGYTNNAPVKLEFVKQDGVAGPITTITGYAGNAPVELTYNGVNGHLGGGMGNSPVDVNLVNCDLFDFLQYFVLFVK